MTCENLLKVICEQQRGSSACTSAQSDQHLFVRCLRKPEFQRVSIAEEAGLNLTRSVIPKTHFHSHTHYTATYLVTSYLTCIFNKYQKSEIYPGRVSGFSEQHQNHTYLVISVLIYISQDILLVGSGFAQA